MRLYVPFLLETYSVFRKTAFNLANIYFSGHLDLKPGNQAPKNSARLQLMNLVRAVTAQDWAFGRRR